VEYGFYVGRPRQKVFRVNSLIPAASNTVYAEEIAAAEHGVQRTPLGRRATRAAVLSCQDLLQRLCYDLQAQPLSSG
jgi:lysine/ornithine N-monooxygenase